MTNIEESEETIALRVLDEAIKTKEWNINYHLAKLNVYQPELKALVVIKETLLNKRREQP